MLVTDALPGPRATRYLQGPRDGRERRVAARSGTTPSRRRPRRWRPRPRAAARPRRARPRRWRSTHPRAPPTVWPGSRWRPATRRPRSDPRRSRGEGRGHRLGRPPLRDRLPAGLLRGSRPPPRAAGRRRPDDDKIRRLLERSRAETGPARSRLAPGPRAGRADGPVPPATPVKGRILHLLTNSLPHRQAGYTVRAQSVALAQVAAGPGPADGHAGRLPAQRGHPAVGGARCRRGHHLSPDPARPGTGARAGGRRLETARGLVPLIADLRPALLQPTTNYVNAQVALALGDRFRLPVVYEVRGFLEETWVSRMGGVAEGGERYHAARAIETECMRRAAGIVTLSETMRADILGRGGYLAGRRDRRPERGRHRRVHAGTARRGTGQQLGIEPGPDGRRVHLQLHVVRGDRLPHRGCRPSARSWPEDQAAARRRRRGPRQPGGDRRTDGVDGGRDRDLHGAGGARRHRAVLPDHRRVRGPADERPCVAAGHAAQAVRGDGDGEGAGRELRSGRCSRSSRKA